MSFLTKLSERFSNLMFDGFKAIIAIAALGRLFDFGDGNRISDESFILAMIVALIMLSFGLLCEFIHWKGGNNGMDGSN